MLKLKGFSSLSLVAKDSLALRRPGALGSKVTWNVVVPLAATSERGCVVMLKSAAFGPLTVTEPSDSVPNPTLLMVNVRWTVPPTMAALPKPV